MRVYIVTCTNHATPESEIVGVFGELPTAINYARRYFFQLCIAEDVPPEQQMCSPQTFIAKKAGLTFAVVEVQHHTVVSEYFPVVSLSREDLMTKGFDADDLEDGTMESIASRAAGYLFDGDYWVAVEQAAEFEKIKRKEDV